MKILIKKNLYFLLPFASVLVFCIVLLASHGKQELHILSNRANSLFFDQFFKYATHLGDGTMIAVLTFLFLFIRFRYSIAFLTGSLLTAGTIQFLKKIVLGDIYRPSKYFELYEDYSLHFVEGVDLHQLHSFPSGHTATAFTVFFMLALVTPNKAAKILFFMAAAIVGYSRVYLSQHFLIDITAGSVIGTVILFFSFYKISKWDKSWLDRSLQMNRK